MFIKRFSRSFVNSAFHSNAVNPVIAAIFAILVVPLFHAMLAPFTAAAQPQPIARFTGEDVFQLEWADDPRISPDGRQIVYLRSRMSVMQDRRQRNIWVINADGSDHRKLTLRTGSESSPRWSPDGNRLAYIASTEEGAELHVHWMDTGQTAQLTQLVAIKSGVVSRREPACFLHARS